MIYGSVCSGIEAATVAWHPLGWKAAFYSEIDKFPSAVLAHHYPTVPNFGDFTTIRPEQHDPIDLLVGGTPCQSFSVAGLRGGLADDRGNLALEFLRLADRARPRWLVWENVPGVLSSNGGRDFGSILGGMVELGYGIAYRVLDAQYCRVDGFPGAVPQRRRRAAAVLFERASLLGDSAPGRVAGERIAPTISARPSGGGGLGTDFDCDGGLVADSVAFQVGNLRRGAGAPPSTEVFPTLKSDHGRGSSDQAPCVAIQERAVCENPNAGPDGAGIRTDGAAYTIEARTVPQAVAFDMRGREGGAQFEGPHDTANIRAASGGSSRSYVAQTWAVRRLTPEECEALQGFPRCYTNIPWRGKGGAPDGPRYKALGNSMAVNVMRWIGRRIEMVEAMNLSQQAAE